MCTNYIRTVNVMTRLMSISCIKKSMFHKICYLDNECIGIPDVTTVSHWSGNGNPNSELPTPRNIDSLKNDGFNIIILFSSNKNADQSGRAV
jgi:hypothetical protein